MEGWREREETRRRGMREEGKGRDSRENTNSHQSRGSDT